MATQSRQCGSTLPHTRLHEIAAYIVSAAERPSRKDTDDEVTASYPMMEQTYDYGKRK
jgi:hypothetical protein